MAYVPVVSKSTPVGTQVAGITVGAAAPSSRDSKNASTSYMQKTGVIAPPPKPPTTSSSSSPVTMIDPTGQKDIYLVEVGLGDQQDQKMLQQIGTFAQGSQQAKLAGEVYKGPNVLQQIAQTTEYKRPIIVGQSSGGIRQLTPSEISRGGVDSSYVPSDKTLTLKDASIFSDPAKGPTQILTPTNTPRINGSYDLTGYGKGIFNVDRLVPGTNIVERGNKIINYGTGEVRYFEQGQGTGVYYGGKEGRWRDEKLTKEQMAQVRSQKGYLDYGTPTPGEYQEMASKTLISLGLEKNQTEFQSRSVPISFAGGGLTGINFDQASEKINFMTGSVSPKTLDGGFIYDPNIIASIMPSTKYKVDLSGMKVGTTSDILKSGVAVSSITGITSFEDKGTSQIPIGTEESNKAAKQYQLEKEMGKKGLVPIYDKEGKIVGSGKDNFYSEFHREVGRTIAKPIISSLSMGYAGEVKFRELETDRGIIHGIGDAAANLLTGASYGAGEAAKTYLTAGILKPGMSLIGKTPLLSTALASQKGIKAISFFESSPIIATTALTTGRVAAGRGISYATSYLSEKKFDNAIKGMDIDKRALYSAAAEYADKYDRERGGIAQSVINAATSGATISNEAIGMGGDAAYNIVFQKTGNKNLAEEARQYFKDKYKREAAITYGVGNIGTQSATETGGRLGIAKIFATQQSKTDFGIYTGKQLYNAIPGLTRSIFAKEGSIEGIGTVVAENLAFKSGSNRYLIDESGKMTGYTKGGLITYSPGEGPFGLMPDIRVGRISLVEVPIGGVAGAITSSFFGPKILREGLGINKGSKAKEFLYSEGLNLIDPGERPGDILSDARKIASLDFGKKSYIQPDIMKLPSGNYIIGKSIVTKSGKTFINPSGKERFFSNAELNIMDVTGKTMKTPRTKTGVNVFTNIFSKGSTSTQSSTPTQTQTQNIQPSYGKSFVPVTQVINTNTKLIIPVTSKTNVMQKSKTFTPSIGSKLSTVSNINTKNQQNEKTIIPTKTEDKTVVPTKTEDKVIVPTKEKTFIKEFIKENTNQNTRQETFVETKTNVFRFGPAFPFLGGGTGTGGSGGKGRRGGQSQYQIRKKALNLFGVGSKWA